MSTVVFVSLAMGGAALAGVAALVLSNWARHARKSRQDHDRHAQAPRKEERPFRDSALTQSSDALPAETHIPLSAYQSAGRSQGPPQPPHMPPPTQRPAPRVQEPSAVSGGYTRFPDPLKPPPSRQPARRTQGPTAPDWHIDERQHGPKLGRVEREQTHWYAKPWPADGHTDGRVRNGEQEHPRQRRVEPHTDWRVQNGDLGRRRREPYAEHADRRTQSPEQARHGHVGEQGALERAGTHESVYPRVEVPILSPLAPVWPRGTTPPYP